jgi:Tfp pilus assembly protein PilF
MDSSTFITIITALAALIGAASPIIVALIQPNKDKPQQPNGIYLPSNVVLHRPKTPVRWFVILFFAFFGGIVGFSGAKLASSNPLAETPVAILTNIAPTDISTEIPTITTFPPTFTPQPTNTNVPPTFTPQPTNTNVPPTFTPQPTNTNIPPTSTPAPTSTNIPTTSSANHYFQMGFADYQSQRYDEAIINLNSCVQFDSSFSDCYHILGMAYRQKNNYIQAILNHDKAIALDPRYDYYFERGVTYHQKSVFTKPAEYNKAISDFKSCLELNPTFSNCLTRLGMVYRDSGNLAQALIYHNQAIELSPERADFYWERGITYQKMGDTGKANADFQKARDLGYGS